MVLPYLIAHKPNDCRNHQQYVASANGANALSIFIPCHRVIGQNGQLTGYAGGLSAKQYLLELEQRNKNIFSLFPSVHKVSE